MLESQPLFAALLLVDPQRLRIQKRRLALNVIDIPLLRELPQSPGQLADYAFLPGTQFCEVDFRLRKVDPPIGGLARLGQQLGYVQQSFRRDAAAVEAYPSGIWLGIDQ